MSKTVIREKRKNPRVNQEVPVELITSESVDKSSGKTKDLSCVGAKILLDHSLPTQTQYEITLELPAGPQTFRGIVVRSESVDNDMYEVSLYFNDIAMESRSKINDFVKEKWV